MKEKLLLAIISIVFSMPVAGQKIASVSGKVVNPAGEPLYPATVQLKGTMVGGATDFDGYFTLEKVEADDTLQVRFIGYLPQNIAVAGRTFIQITLRPSEGLLDEIVVTGYQTEKKSELTGAVSKIKGRDMEQNQSLSVERLMQGQAAGVLIKGRDGIPGGKSRVLIRGITSVNSGTDPLYIVDGVPVDSRIRSDVGLSGTPLAFLSPQDIESIEVLKDAASASIYGAQAANGVILITTKKGEKGKTRFNFSTYQGVSTRLNEQEVMTSQELVRFRMLQYENDALMRGFSNPVGRGILHGLQETGFDFSAYPIRSYQDAEENIPREDIDRFIEALPTYDWEGVSYRQGYVQNYQLSAQGGSEATRYFTSINLNSTESHLKKSGFRRAQFRINLNHEVNDKLQFGAKLSLSANRQTALKFNFFGESPIASGATFPWNPIFDEAGDYDEPLLGQPFHPLKHIDYSDLSGTTNQLLGAFFVDYQLFSTLKYRGSYGIDYLDYQWDFWVDPRTFISAYRGWRSIDTERKANQTTTHLLQYTPRIGSDHSLNTLLVWEYRHQKAKYMGATGEDFPNELFRTLDAAGNTVGSRESTSAFKYLGTLLNAKYAYKSRYYLSGSIRYDGSSRFGATHRFGWFPSLSASWRISEEPFFGGQFVNDLKLRAGWGVTGNSLIGDFAARGLAVAGGFRGAYLGQTSIYITQLANERLTWEQQKEWNIGIDYALWKHRLSGSVEVYRRITEDMLFNRDLVPSSSFYSIKENLGKLLSRGLEFSINARVIDTRGLRWENRFNIALQHQEILELYSGKRNEGLLQVGYPPALWVVYDYAGINPANGRAMWYDHAGNLTYKPSGGDFLGADNDDRIVLNYPTDVFGGMNSSLSFAGFTLSAFFNFEFGKWGKESLDDYYLDVYRPNANHLRELWEDAWMEPGDLARWPRPGTRPLPGFPSYFVHRTLQKMDFIRLKQLNLTYDLPGRWLRKWSVHKASIFIQGTNLLTFTGYTGLDPEFDGGYSNLTYPLGKVYTVGVDVGF